VKRLLALLFIFLASPGFAAVCTITEHKNLYILPNGLVTPLPDDPYRRQSVTYTTTAATANAFGNATKYIGISCNALAHYKMAVSPTAINTDTIIPNGVQIYIPVTRGDKIAFYDGTS